MRSALVLSALLMSTAPVYAASHTTEGEDAAGTDMETTSETSMDSTPLTETMLSASTVEDAEVYSLGDAYDANLWESNEPFGPITADWADIGDVEDLIINASGQVLGVTVDIGGFLGMGENTVLIPLEDVRLVQNPDDSAIYVVTRMSRSALEEAEEVEGVIHAD